MKKWLLVITVMLVSDLLAAPVLEVGTVVGKGRTVSIEYTLKLKDGLVVASTDGQRPVTFIQGAGKVVPGLERELTGMKVGDSKDVVVPPRLGYGQVKPEEIVEVAKSTVPKAAHKVGAALQGQHPSGKLVRSRVVAVGEETVTLDFNHPMAGKTLHFVVKVVGIR